MTNRVTAVFNDRNQAEQAISALRQMGVNDAHLSIISRHGENANVSGAGSTADAAGDVAGDTGKGLMAGAGVGALFGLAAALIPGAGPFIAAGTLASALGSAAAGGAVAGAIVGGTSGAIAGALTNAGYDKHESDYYGGAVESGGVLVAVDTDGNAASADQVRAVLAQYGGRSAAGMSV
jgi:hypothetical protein